jgi:hypothetical protein
LIDPALPPSAGWLNTKYKLSILNQSPQKMDLTTLMPDFAAKYGEAHFKQKLAEGYFDFWEARHERNANET